MALTVPRWWRGTALLGAAGAGAALAYGHLIEPRWLGVERWTVRVPELPAAWEGLRLVHLTDFQVGMRWQSPAYVSRAVEVAAALRPDLVILTGDFMHHGRWSGEADVFRPLTALAPAYAVLGNHDHAGTADDAAGISAGLRDQGVRVLNNAHAAFTWRGEERTLVGIDDFATHHADLLRAVEGIAPGTRILALLSHVPDAAPLVPPGWFPLVLSGHTHGSRIGFAWPRRFSVRRALRAVRPLRYPRGWFAFGETLLYVNRGIGLSSLPVRLGSRPEVALLVLTDGRALPDGTRWRRGER